MHPEIRQNGPGSCPICGMDLVPEKGAVTSEEEMAYKLMARKFWIALALSIPVFVIAMSEFFQFSTPGPPRLKGNLGMGSVCFGITCFVLLKLGLFSKEAGVQYAAGLPICGP